MVVWLAGSEVSIMAAIRDIAFIANKWSEVTSRAGPQYEAGVRAPKADWAKGATDANEAWKAGVTAAVSADSFRKGVAQAGTPRWSEGAIVKGVPRFGPGVALAESRYAERFGPYAQAIAGLTLPPRFARRDPRNLNRVQAVVNAMIETKKRLA